MKRTIHKTIPQWQCIKAVRFVDMDENEWKLQEGTIDKAMDELKKSVLKRLARDKLGKLGDGVRATFWIMKK